MYFFFYHSKACMGKISIFFESAAFYSQGADAESLV